MSNNFFKVDHRYNSRGSEISSKYSQNPSILPSRSNVLAIASKFNRPHIEEPSYQNQIIKILTKWNKLQDEKKKNQEKDEFVRIIEDDLENQLKELEQVIDKQIEQEHRQYSIADFKHDDIEKLIEMQELLAIDEQKQKQQRNNLFLEQLKKFQREKQSKMISFDLWKQKHETYLKQILSKANQMQMNKIIGLLKAYYRTKKYYVDILKQSEK